MLIVPSQSPIVAHSAHPLSLPAGAALLLAVRAYPATKRHTQAHKIHSTADSPAPPQCDKGGKSCGLRAAAMADKGRSRWRGGRAGASETCTHLAVVLAALRARRKHSGWRQGVVTSILNTQDALTSLSATRAIFELATIDVQIPKCYAAPVASPVVRDAPIWRADHRANLRMWRRSMFRYRSSITAAAIISPSVNS